MDGLVAVLPLMNSTNPEVQEHAAWVVGKLEVGYASRTKVCYACTVGTAVKFQKDLQEKAAQLGALPLLINMFHDGMRAQHVSASRALYALGSILRGSDDAHYAFLAYGGLNILTETMEHFNEQSSKYQRKMAVKAATLLFDLFQEQAFQHCGEHSTQSSCINMDVWKFYFLPSELNAPPPLDDPDSHIVMLDNEGKPAEHDPTADLACSALSEFVTQQVCDSVEKYASAVAQGSSSDDTIEKV